MTSVYYYEFPVGKVGIAEDGKGICALFFPEAPAQKDADRQEKERAGWILQETDLIRRTRQELEEYFAGTRREFDLPLSLTGTDFQLQDWKTLQTIPYGETCSYKDIAVKLGKPAACRAVGMANHCNPVSILIPCHRVIGKNGSLTGYGGGLSVKEYLLDLERRTIK